MLVAYGLQAGAPWYYFALLLPFMAAFIYIPGGIGRDSVPAVRAPPGPHAAARAWPSWRGRRSLVVALFGWSLLARTEGNLLTPLWFQEMLARLQFSEHRLLPSWWLSSGLLEAARSRRRSAGTRSWAESLLFLSLLISNALVLARAGGGDWRADLSHQLQRAAHRARAAAARAGVLARSAGDALHAAA